MLKFAFTLILLYIPLLFGAPDSSFLIDTVIQYGPAYGTRGEPIIAGNGEHFFVVWADYRKGFDLYGTRVEHDGTILDPAGIKIVNTAIYQMNKPAIVYNDQQYILLYSDNSPVTQLEIEIFAIRVLPGGMVPDSMGRAISSMAYCESPAIVCGDSVSFAAWRNSDDHLYGIRLSPDGVPVDSEPVAITTSQLAFNVSAGFDGINFWAVWRSPSGIYGARISQSGTLLDTAVITIAQFSADRNYLKTSIASGDNQCLIVWTNKSTLRKAKTVSGSRVTSEGTVLDSGGIAIATVTDYYSSPYACFTGSNYFITWGDYSIDYGVRGAFLISDGSVSDSLSITRPGGGTPNVAADSTNTFTVWREGMDYTDDACIYGSRISHNGVIIDTQSLLLSTAVKAQVTPAIASNGVEYFLVWQELCKGSGQDIYGIRLDSSGTLLQPHPSVIYEDSGDQQNPAIAGGAQSWLVLWENSRRKTGFSGKIVTHKEQAPAAIIPISETGRGPAVTFNGNLYLAIWVNSHDYLYGVLITESGAISEPGILVLNKDNKQTKSYDPPAVASVDSISLALWSPYSEPG